jgi:hypothetical protein
MPSPHKQSCHIVGQEASGKRGDNWTANGKGQQIRDDRLDLSDLCSTDEEWEKLLSCFPVDLQSTARDAKAIQRLREIRSASDLLRLVLAYCLCDWSLRLVGAWANLKGIGELSDVAVLNRLRLARPWLGILLAEWLRSRRAEFATGRPVRLRLIDATGVSRPGSRGTDWRIHISYDAGKMCVDGAEVTDARGGETLVRHVMQPGDIGVADRGYAHRKGIGSIFAQGGLLVVRINWCNLPMRGPTGQAFDLIEWLRQLGDTQLAEHMVVVDTPQGSFQLRLIARRLPQQVADAARQHIHSEAKKKGRTPNANTLLAAGFVLIVSNLPTAEWNVNQILAIYRFRWQVEMLFKRLKGILHLDHLRAKDADLCQTYLLGKLLSMIALEKLTESAPRECTEWFECVERPVSPWRWLVFNVELLAAAVRGHLDLSCVLPMLPKLRRYLSDGPRKRSQQHILIRRLFASSSGSGINLLLSAQA